MTTYHVILRAVGPKNLLVDPSLALRMTGKRRRFAQEEGKGRRFAQEDQEKGEGSG